jgi:hypothetical protein
MATVSVRYIVDDVDEAITFYSLPQPGGWNRIQLQVNDLDAVVRDLRDHGAPFRNQIVDGVGGRQILVEDPSGNPVELFEPTRDEARLAT